MVRWTAASICAWRTSWNGGVSGGVGAILVGDFCHLHFGAHLMDIVRKVRKKSAVIRARYEHADGVIVVVARNRSI